MKETILGVIRYTEEGNVICEICGKDFKKPLSHVWQKHGISSAEYKKEFGLDAHKGVLSPTSKKLARQRVYENQKCITENLLKNGKKTRFEQGSIGRPKEKIRPQTAIRLSKLHTFNKNQAKKL